ncbi:MAG: Transcription elongation factor GreA [Alphaproteobacteria bacterium MarineAlpha9_Bin4]|nr:transcription elongation factor GreA [Pelagibacterales bacterium]PPR25491.1 MAG: Transcription elongation factor GreA [Alphaproteobacteria bacterium MarineAlpha9_Bin4]|tara:strand:- start:792 stop:1265 length:474 start_codon:yes stop_codon:yes gene_type:complete
MEKFPITNIGFEKLESELKFLKSTERPNVIKAIAEAREHGDLSENAEYHAAKEKQSFIEGRIADLENKISRAEVINTEILSGDKIIFGATVTLGEVGRKKNIIYQIVGTEEADVENGKISVSSPLARALLGKKIDDLVEVSSPGGSKEYEIENIEFI